MSDKRSKIKITRGPTGRVRTGCGWLYLTLNFHEKRPYEIFARLGKSGGCFASNMDALSRVISKAIQAGEDIREIIEQLKGIRCPSPLISEGTQVLSCADGMAKVLEELFNEEDKYNEKNKS